MTSTKLNGIGRFRAHNKSSRSLAKSYDKEGRKIGSVLEQFKICFARGVE